MFKTIIRLLAIFFLMSLIFIFSLFNVFDDTLFFHSDLRNILRFCTILSGVLGLILSLLAIPFLRFGRVLERASLICACMILTAFLFFLLDAFGRQFGIFPALRKLNLEGFVGLLWPVFFAVIAIKLFKAPSRSEIAARVTRAAMVLSPVLLVLSAISNFYNSSHSEPKHVVLLVLDAMPSQHLNTFNSAVPQTDLDEQLRQALVFRNMRTRTPWTNGYFRTLYNGSPKNATQKWLPTFTRWKNNLLNPQWNLLTALQKSGVKTRWIVWHNAGIPEACQISNYQGFRSILLGHRFSPLWNKIGVDYNVVITTPASESLRTARRKSVYQLLNKDQQFKNILLELLLPEMENMQKKFDRTFLLFHTSWVMSNGSMNNNDATAAWRYDRLEETSDQTAKRIVAAGYKYKSADEWFAKRTEQFFVNSMAITQKKISAFLTECRRRNLFQDTLFILTADHGEMASRGRLWYSYHPEEEVLRVPTAIFFKGKSGIDDRDLQTDNLVKAITDYFQAEAAPNSKELSIFDTEEKLYTASMTLSSDVNREWFVVLYQGDHKYLFNIHPKSSGQAMKFRLQTGSFDTHLLAEGETVLTEAKPYLKQALKEFEIASSDVHPSYRL